MRSSRATSAAASWKRRSRTPSRTRTARPAPSLRYDAARGRRGGAARSRCSRRPCSSWRSFGWANRAVRRPTARATAPRCGQPSRSTRRTRVATTRSCPRCRRSSRPHRPMIQRRPTAEAARVAPPRRASCPTNRARQRAGSVPARPPKPRRPTARVPRAARRRPRAAGEARPRPEAEGARAKPAAPARRPARAGEAGERRAGRLDRRPGIVARLEPQPCRQRLVEPRPRVDAR